MKDITIDSAFVTQLVEGAQKQGLDCDSILLANGISRLALAKSGTRVPLNAFAAFAIAVMTKLDDEFMGLSEVKQPLGSFNMMCRSCISARTIHRSLKRGAKFWNLFANAYRHDIEVTEDRVAYTLTKLDNHTPFNNYVVEALLSSIHRFHCWLGGQFIPLKLVQLDHAEPSYSSGALNMDNPA